MTERIGNRAISSVVLCMVLAIMEACSALESSRPSVEQPPTPPPLVGMAKEAVLSCAGPPQDHLNVHHDVVVLRYYKEAAMLEESQVGSKGSIPGIHRGCWANLLVESGKVTGVEFRPVPDVERDPSLCHQIFDGCSR